jgi:hypothetical protein
MVPQDEKVIVVRYATTTGVPMERMVVGAGIGYKINAPDAPECVKVWKDDLTYIIPMARVSEIETSL